MPHTALSIVNTALAMLGHKTISAIGTGIAADDKAQDIAYRLYEIERNILMAEAPWDFLMAQAELSEDDTETSAIVYGWSFAYELPSTFLKLWGISSAPTGWGVLSWDIPHEARGGFLFTDASPCYITFAHNGIISDGETPPGTSDPEDYFTDDFAYALASRLASKWNVALTGKVTHQQHWLREAMVSVGAAKSRNASNWQGQNVERETWIESRTRVS